jgi:hypothetical protein
VAGTRTIAVLLSISLLFGVGCSTPQAKTPKDAAVNYARSLYHGDKDLFLATVDVEDKEVAVFTFNTITTMLDFYHAFEKVYGKDRSAWLWEQACPTVEEVANEIEIEEDGDKATGAVPGKIHPILFVKKGDVWKVDMSMDVQDGRALKEQIQRRGVDRIAKVLRKNVEEIKARLGKDSIRDVKRALDAAFIHAVTGNVGMVPAGPR